MYISEIRTKAPMDVPRTPLETKMYKMLDKLGIPYEHVDMIRRIQWKNVLKSIK